MRKLLVLATAFAFLAAAPASPALANGGLSNDTADKIDQYVQQVMREGKIPGLSVAIVKGSEIAYLKGFGKADGNRPVTPQTPFTICSVGKTFTALAIRQLAGQGRIRYDATVQTYIPWFTLADPEAAKAITINDLISHKSGLSTASGAEGYTYDTNLSIEGLVRRLKDVEPDRPVGASEEYSNLNFIILGLVVEKVSGMPYADYVRKSIFGPLGMSHSFSDETPAKADGSAMGHSLAFGLIVPSNIPFPNAQVPAGYQLTSAEDMAKFAKLYLSNGYADGHSLFESNTLPERKAPDAASSANLQRYNIYWMPENSSAGYYGHEGGSANFSTMLLVNPASQIAIIVLTNCNNGSTNPQINARTIANDIASEMDNNLGLPHRTAGFGSDWIYTAALVVIAALLALRVYWTARFRRNLARGKRRRVFSLVTYSLLDGLLPLCVLLLLPGAFKVSWPLLLNSNMEPCFLLLLACTTLLAIFVAKTATLLVGKQRSALTLHPK